MTADIKTPLSLDFPTDFQIRLTTEAACMMLSVSGEFEDDEERQELALLALDLREGRALETLTLPESSAAINALITIFADLQKGEQLGNGPLSGCLTPERLGLAHTTLCVHSGRLIDEQDDLLITLLASVALSLFKLETVLVTTEELREQQGALRALRDELEDVMLTASPLVLSADQNRSLRQSLIASIEVVNTQPGLLTRVNMIDDLRARLSVPFLNDAYRTLISLDGPTRGQA